MTRKDYIAIAATLAYQREHAHRAYGANTFSAVCEVLDQTANGLADTLAVDNSRFDRAKFLAACGVQS